MEMGSWANWTAAGIAAASAVASLIGWWLSRAAKAEATKQAGIATQARIDTAESLKRIADIGTAQQQAQTEQLTAEEIEPWAVDPVPGYNTAAHLRNKTSTPKYGIIVTGEFVEDDVVIDFIGPRDRKQFGIFIDVSAEVWVEVTWHLRKDLTDSPTPQKILIP